MSELNKYFEFQLGDVVRHKVVGLSEKGWLAVEVRYLVVARAVCEEAGSRNNLYWLRGCNNRGEVGLDVLRLPEAELVLSEPFSMSPTGTPKP